MCILFHYIEGWKQSGLRLNRTLAWLGICIGMSIGLAHCGWGSDTASTHTDQKTQEKSARSAKTTDRTAKTPTRAGKAGGETTPIRSLLPEQASEPISPEGREREATSRPKNASVAENRLQERTPELDPRDGQSIDREGRQIEEVEALADLRQELAEDIQEERRAEHERAAAAQLALGNQDQDAERADVLEAAGLEPDDISEVGGIEEGYAAGLNAEAELSSDLARLNTTDVQGRDIEEVEALADLREEIAADIEAERRAEEEQVSDYELILNDNDQDSGLDPHQETQEDEPEPLKSAVGVGLAADGEG